MLRRQGLKEKKSTVLTEWIKNSKFRCHKRQGERVSRKNTASVFLATIAFFSKSSSAP